MGKASTPSNTQQGTKINNEIMPFSSHPDLRSDEGWFYADGLYLKLRMRSRKNDMNAGSQFLTSTSKWPTGKSSLPPLMFIRASRILMYDTSGSMPTFVDEPLNHNLAVHHMRKYFVKLLC